MLPAHAPTNINIIKIDLENAGHKSKFSVENPVVEITDANTARQVMRLVDRMEELDDVQQVTANYELADAIAEELAAEE